MVVGVRVFDAPSIFLGRPGSSVGTDQKTMAGTIYQPRDLKFRLTLECSRCQAKE